MPKCYVLCIVTTDNDLGLELEMDISPIVKLVCIMVIWLNLKAGVSRDTANIILKVIQFILSMTFSSLQLALASSLGINVTLPEIQIPQDIRTAYHLYSSEPDITRTVCCPKCYSLYTGEIPVLCGWKESPRAKACKAELWRLQQFGRQSKWVPKTTYNTQNFDSWLQSFLGRRSIENHLEGTYQKTAPFLGEKMHDMHDSPAWKDLQDYLSQRYHLVFGLYIDWFNPYTNKIAGKSELPELRCISRIGFNLIYP